MRASSAALLFPARQDQRAELRAVLAGRVDEIRRLMVCHTPHGEKDDVAALAGIRPDQLSRQLNGRERLDHRVVDAWLEIYREHEELKAVVTAIYILRNGGTAQIRERTGLFVLFDANGQLCLPGLEADR